jgi:hypothetical protein
MQATSITNFSEQRDKNITRFTGNTLQSDMVGVEIIFLCFLRSNDPPLFVFKETIMIIAAAL